MTVAADNDVSVDCNRHHAHQAGRHVAVEEEKGEDKPKTKTLEKTAWDWLLVNESKPIWAQKPNDIEQTDL